MNTITPLEEAAYVYAHREDYDTAGMNAAIDSLGAWNIFSARQIAAILNIDVRRVLKRITKADRSGGRLAPEALPLLVELVKVRAEGNVNVFLARDALQAGTGTSSYVAAALTGIPRRTLQRHAEEAEAV